MAKYLLTKIDEETGKEAKINISEKLIEKCRNTGFNIIASAFSNVDRMFDEIENNEVENKEVKVEVKKETKKVETKATTSKTTPKTKTKVSSKKTVTKAEKDPSTEENKEEK